jgi:hypothetical protein
MANANVIYENIPPNTEGHGIDIDLVYDLQHTWKLQTNVRLVAQRLYLLNVSEAAQVGYIYQIRTTAHTTNTKTKPAFQWLSQPFKYTGYSKNSKVRKAAVSSPTNICDR